MYEIVTWRSFTLEKRLCRTLVLPWMHEVGFGDKSSIGTCEIVGCVTTVSVKWFSTVHINPVRCMAVQVH